MRALTLIPTGRCSRMLVPAALVALVLLCVTGPARAADDVLRIGTTSRPATLNPFAPLNRGAQAILSLVYDSLVVSGADAPPTPGLATRWRPSRDRRSWLLTIRSGVRWSNGTPLTAEDVAYSLRRAAESRGPLARYLPGLVRVEATGARVLVRLRQPLARFPDLPLPIVPRAVWQTVGSSELATYENAPPVGSGPFRVTRIGEDVLRLTANADHFAGRPSLDAIEFRFFDRDEELALALRDGTVDVADDLSPTAYDQLAAFPGVVRREAPGLTFVSLGINSGTRGDGEPVLRVRTIRQAVAHAVDRDRIRQTVLAAHGQTGSTIVPPASPFHADPGAEAPAFDRDAAERLLAESGFRDRDDDGALEGRDRLPLGLRLFTRASLPETGIAGTLIADSLRALGIGVQETALTDAELARRIRNGNYDLFVWGWSTEADPDVVLSALTCDERGPRGLNDTWFCNERYDRLFARQRREADPDRRRDQIAALQRIAALEAPYVVLYYRPWLQAYRSDRVPGLAAAPTGQPLLYGAGARPLSRIAVSGPHTAPPAPVPTGPPSVIADTVDSQRLWWAIAGGAVAVALAGWVLLTGRSRRVLAREHLAREEAERRREAARRRAAREAGLRHRPAPGAEPDDLA